MELVLVKSVEGGKGEKEGRGRRRWRGARWVWLVCDWGSRSNRVPSVRDSDFLHSWSSSSLVSLTWISVADQ
jgi:hypothetical protein